MTRILTLQTFTVAWIVGGSVGLADQGQEAQIPATSAADKPLTTSVVSLDGGDWLLATDAKNVGRQEFWYRTPRPEAKRTRVPWIIQEAFPGYHGLAWYWRTFVAPARSGETLQAIDVARRLPPGDTPIETVLQVDNPRLWELNDPALYRVSARFRSSGSPSFDEQSARCGFRDFRFENGCFRLNGRRIFLKS